MKIKNFFKRTVNKPRTNDELVTTVGLTNFYSLEGMQYNPDNISLETYKKISRHYQVSASLAIISYSIQQIDWDIQTDDKKIKEVLTYSVDKIWNSLIRSISKAFIFGFSPNIKVFTIEEIDGKQFYVYKKIKDLDPSECTVKVDKYGVFDGFYYRKGTSDEVLVTPQYAFWYANNMENGNHYGEAMLKKVYKPWWYSEKIHVFSNRYYERFGEPLIVGRSPSGVSAKDDDGQIKPAQQLMNEIIANIRNHSSAQLPSDRDVNSNEYLYDIKYIESQMRGFDFEGYLSRLDSEISRGLLLPDLMLGGKSGGSYALGSTQTETFYTNLMGIMDNIVDYVNAYILPQLIEYNFSKNKKAKFIYQPLSVENKKFINDVILESVKKGVLKIDTNQLEERSGFKMEEKEIKETVKENKIEEKDVEKIAEEKIKNSMIKEKEDRLNKKIDEIDQIKNDLMSFYDEEQ